MTVTEATIDEIPFRGGALAVVAIGEGSTIGYLHGFVGNPGVHPFLEALAGADFRVVAPSLPGFTGSSPCADLRTMHDWVVATSEVLDVTGTAGQPFVAASVGAMLALEVAAARPEAFDRLVLIDPLGLWDSDHPVADPFGTTLGGQRSLLTVDPERTAAFFDDPDGLTDEQRIEDGLTRYLSRTAAAALVWPIPDHGLDTRLHRVTCPVHIVWGAADALAPTSYADLFAEALPNVVGISIIEGAGHLAEWDRPAEVAAVVTDVLG